MTMIQLFHGQLKDKTIDVIVFVDDKTGDLIIEGCDSFENTSNADQEDEEYWLRILKDDKAKLFASFEPDAKAKMTDTALLKFITKKYNTSSGFADLRAWCATHHVPVSFSSYS